MRHKLCSHDYIYINISLYQPAECWDQLANTLKFVFTGDHLKMLNLDIIFIIFASFVRYMGLVMPCLKSYFAEKFIVGDHTCIHYCYISV